MQYQRTRLVIHALTHLVVDMACFFVLFARAVDLPSAVWLIFIYNTLAFGLQLPFGAFADTIDDVRPMTILGAGLVAWGVMLYASPIPAILLLGTGNALFHAGGAVATMRHCPGNAAYAGIYVAPGALGVALGTLAGRQLSLAPMFIVFMLLICILSIWAVGPGAERAHAQTRTPDEPAGLGIGAVFLCLLSICIRAFMGFSITAPAVGTALMAALFVFLGKLLGGLLARRIPWRVLAFTGVGLGGTIMAFFPGNAAIYAGLLLFNLAMPLTLAAVMGTMRENCGLGFGLTTFALYVGTVPLYVLPKNYAAPAWLILALTAAAALMLLFALKGKSVQAASEVDGGAGAQGNDPSGSVPVVSEAGAPVDCGAGEADQADAGAGAADQSAVDACSAGEPAAESNEAGRPDTGKAAEAPANAPDGGVDTAETNAAGEEHEPM